MQGGFTFRAPREFRFDVQGDKVMLSDLDGMLMISLMGVTDNTSAESPEGLIDGFLESLTKKTNAQFIKGGSQAIAIDGHKGLAIDLTGKMFDAPIRGQTVLVMVTAQQYLYGLGVSNLSKNKDIWDKQGSKVFGDLLNSVKFSDVANMGSPCRSSTDKTYGYTMENPIKVSGGFYFGPRRERAFLGTLQGPNGQIIKVDDRVGSRTIGDITIDMYRLSYDGLAEPITLYIDMYNYSSPAAPVGFTCSSPFPLTAP
jgi:hypothetical protein